MILQALVRHYEDLAARNEVPRLGWGTCKVSYALRLNDEGTPVQVISLKVPAEKKSMMVPQVLTVPMPVKRSVGILPNFLCDNAGYLLGADGKGNPERTAACFAACRDLHLRLLDGLDSPAAQAVCAFFRTWEPTQVCPALEEDLENLKSGVNLVFWYGEAPVYCDAAVKNAWDMYYAQTAEGVEQVCLVTGRRAPAVTLHPSIKGVQGAQSSGASLVSFNAPALESFGHEQGLNAPVSQYAAFAYGTALNHLLSDRNHTQRIGDTSIVFWAEGGEPAYQGFTMAALFGQKPTELTEYELQSALSALANGNPVDFQGTRLCSDTHFYILGLAPNAARLSVRFFLQDRFGGFMEHLQAHYERLKIVKPSFDTWETLPLWRLLQETVNAKASDKTPSPRMSGEVLRAILTGGRYPSSLLTGVILRIRADHQISRGRAAILKAYYLRNPDTRCPKEVLIVELDPNQAPTNIPFTLGRLFSVLEAIQQAANPGINATIKDKYFNSASSIPATIFPILGNLAQKHLRKLDRGMRIHYEKQLAEFSSLVGDAYPSRLSLPEQGSFQLGYYHQTQLRYAGIKKEET